MGNFLSYAAKLRQYVPGLAPEQSKDFINQAWRDIREANEQWSFLWAQEYWLSAPSITLTGLTVTKNSTSVGLSAPDVALLGGLNNPSLTQRQIRFGLSGGPIYSIESSDVQQVTDGQIASGFATLTSPSGPFSASDVGLLVAVEGAGASGGVLYATIIAFIDPTQVTLDTNASTTVASGGTVTWGSTLTLDRLFREDSAVGTQTALVYRIYYSPLSTDFQRVDHLVDQISGYEFGWAIEAIRELDRMDPQRSSVTQPYRIFLHHFDEDSGLPVYELWPGPTIDRAYSVSYWRLGLDFSDDTDSLPPQIPEELLLLRARMLAYEWGMVTDQDPKRRLSYANAIGYVRSRYSTEGQPGRPLGLLEKSKRRDKSVYLKQIQMQPTRGPRMGWPIDSNFLQSHAYSMQGS